MEGFQLYIFEERKKEENGYEENADKRKESNFWWESWKHKNWPIKNISWYIFHLNKKPFFFLSFFVFFSPEKKFTFFSLNLLTDIFL